MNATGKTYIDGAVGTPRTASAVTGAAKYSIPCPLCAHTCTFHAFIDSGCKVRGCDNCGLFFVDPYPRPSDQHHQVFSQQCPGIELLDCGRRYEGERLYYERHFEWIAEECAGAHSILDVGCGTGHLLERLASRFDCYRLGIELNPSAARLARDVAKCDVLELPFETFRSDRKFDVITMINVFSHIASFDAMFESLRAALAANGRVILRTTEMSRRVSRWNQVHWGVPDDLHFLGLNTLEFLCWKYGFRVARHVRVPFEDELFRLSRWRQMGRSRAQNAIKHAVLRTPGALAVLRSLYTAGLGSRLFVSFIVLKPIWEITRIPASETVNSQRVLGR